MDNLSLSFPQMPAGADKSIIRPSAAFTKKVYHAIGAIALFVFSYLFLFACAIGIAIAFGALGVGIMSLKLHWLTLVLGIGLIGSGLMLIYFVTKFLFKSSTEDRSDMVELSAEDQSQLFAFISKITEEANAPAPKRIYISAEVNAAVFYDSSFWSMFFPVKKNLKIGLGLVNSVNVSEFKAVMAHEFGHFAQRSMKFGSYVYNFNKVIYNMLYDNDDYEQVLGSLASGHSILQFLALINIKIIKGMQYLLRQVYVVLNTTYMGLSREMEFHADAVAAYVSGSSNMVTSLKRVEIGQECYSRLLDYWNAKIGEGQRSANIYPQQQELIQLYANSRSMQTDDAGLPVVERGGFVADNSQIIIADQWASHPSTYDRERALNRINLTANTQHAPAWSLFANAAQLQEQLTAQLYSGVNQTNDNTAFVNLEDFKADFYKNADIRVLDKIYKGYYDDRNIEPFDVDEAISSVSTHQELTLENLLTAENANLPKAADRMDTDIAILDAVINIRDDVKTFDYKGVKYKREKAEHVQTMIMTERGKTLADMGALDKQLFAYFYHKAGLRATELADKYKQLFAYQARAVADYEQFNSIRKAFDPVYETMPFTKIKEALDVVYELEKDLKPRIAEIIADEQTKAFIIDEQLKEIDDYLSVEHVYFEQRNYDEAAIAHFNNGTAAYIAAVSKRHFDMKKELLKFQLTLLDRNAA